MATRENFRLTPFERQRRVFSEEFKRIKVREIELKQSTIAEIHREYQVSRTNVHRWIDLYGSKSGPKTVRLVVEMDSDSKKLKELRIQIAELERKLGQKQILIDFQEKMLQMVEEEYGNDFKKKLLKELSSGSGEIEKD